LVGENQVGTSQRIIHWGTITHSIDETFLSGEAHLPGLGPLGEASQGQLKLEGRGGNKLNVIGVCKNIHPRAAETSKQVVDEYDEKCAGEGAALTQTRWHGK
jgi:hypothetical protein